ncbi:hypothetical protein DPMN_099976 [Dreissena polymorpha]|uniref:Uncharacterized protein n=1 Tax=Dreissena polymorpha TaxID=45954 RepID=A0A9D4R714_DREPO|nr:hypothetical protein DPMN_099976 [Dreissena polymorpha]
MSHNGKYYLKSVKKRKLLDSKEDQKTLFDCGLKKNKHDASNNSSDKADLSVLVVDESCRSETAASSNEAVSVSQEEGVCKQSSDEVSQLESVNKTPESSQSVSVTSTNEAQ